MRGKLLLTATLGPVLAIVAVFVLAGCGGSTKTITQIAPAQTSSQTSSAATMTKQQAGQAYLAAVAPANAAGDALTAKMQAYSDSTTGDQVSADAQPFEQQLTTLNAKLLALANSYPPAASDLKALVSAYNPVVGDLQSASAQNAFSAASWVQQLASDLSKTKAAVAIVRADLGLPPAKS